MKAHRRLMISLKNIEAERARVRNKTPLSEWLKQQPGSVKRGIARGTFQLPSYVYDDTPRTPKPVKVTT